MFNQVACMVAGFAAAVTASQLNLAPVQVVNATKYLGRWYQMYSDAFIEDTFEYDSYCDTADYGLNTNGSVSVHNRERIGSTTGQESQIYGYADQSNTTAGALTVYLQGVPTGAPYWIFQLGPPTYGPDGLYEYSVVSDPFQLSLFVLARNVTQFYQQYDLPLRNWLNASGWNTGINTPLATVQRGCTYW